MPFSQSAPSEEAQRTQQGSQALGNNHVPTRYSYTNAGWLQDFIDGQETPARPLFNDNYIQGLRKDWEVGESAGVIDEDTDDEDDEDDLDDDATVDVGEEETSVSKVVTRGNLHVVKSESTEPFQKGTWRIDEFCGHIQFKDLLDLDPKARPVAIMEENSRGGVYRKYMGPLNPYNLRTMLQQLRYERRSGDTLWARPDVDQRRLCILDNSPVVAAILLETASNIDAMALPELLYLHLERKPSVGVSITPRDTKRFTFRLSLPFYRAIRKTQPKRASTHQKTLSIPLIGDFVIGQSTLILSGVDEQRWSAFAVIDGSARDASRVKHGGKHSKRLRKDPITNIDYFSPNTSYNARSYFPLIWEAWISQAVDDWTEVIDAIKAGIMKKDEQDAILCDANGSDAIKELMKSIATGAKWDYMVTPMHTELSGMLRAFEQFQTSGTKYFNDDTMPSDDDFATRDSFLAIQDKYDELVTLHNLLGDLLASLRRPQLNNVRDAKMRDLGLRETRDHAKKNVEITYYAAESQKRAAKKAIKSHDSMAKSAWKSTVTTIALLPCMLVFTAFSMQSSAMPFEPSFEMLLRGLGLFTVGTLILFNFLDILIGLFHGLIRTVWNFLVPKARPVPERELEASPPGSDDSDFEFDT